jgi:hypothetical protein
MPVSSFLLLFLSLAILAYMTLNNWIFMVNRDTMRG